MQTLLTMQKIVNYPEFKQQIINMKATEIKEFKSNGICIPVICNPLILSAIVFMIVLI